MKALFNHPLFIAVAALLVMWGAAQFGARFSKVRQIVATEFEEFNLVLGATLTLLGLIVGFAFSMAVGRYDQRKNYEEEEANAIGTEYVRADLLPPADGDKVRALLKQYLAKRIEFYQAGGWDGLAKIDSQTAQLQNQMWSVVADAVKAQPTAVAALAVSGMNDVLNRQGYTQASWWNRIPVAAWAFIVAIAVCCNLLMGFAARDVKARRLFMVLPVVLAIAFLLLSDLDSPRGGIIRVAPQNLLTLSDSLR
jgi:hypothetical protein